MIKDTINRIRNRIENSASISEGAKDELVELIEKLESEIGEMPEDAPGEGLRSALGLTELSAHESSRSDHDRESTLKEQTFGALRTSIQELEAAHPRLAETLARISNILSRMGI